MKLLSIRSGVIPNLIWRKHFTMNRIEKSFSIACEIYREHGVDPVQAIEILKNIPDFPGIILGFLWIIPISF